MTRARVLADLGNSGTFSAKADTNRVGISSANPTATLDVTGDVNVSSAATFGGNVTVGGVLTYEDVTNVDSVGVLTARLGANISGGDGLKVTANGAQITGVSTFSSAIDANGDLDVDGQTDLDNLVVAGVSTFSSLIDLNAELDVDGQTDLDTLVVAGVSTFSAALDINAATNISGDLTIADKIVHDGDTNTAIRFPAADTFSVETAGSERLLVDSSGNVDIGNNDGSSSNTGWFIQPDGSAYVFTDGSTDAVKIFAGSADERITLKGDGELVISDKITHMGDTNTNIRFPAADTFAVETAGSERLRITSAGKVLVGFTTVRSNFYNTSTINPKLQIEGTDYSSSALSITANGASNSRNPYSILLLSRSRGTDFASNTVVADDDVLGAVDFQGNDGTQFVSAAAIEAIVDGTPGADDMPGALTFLTTADGASTPTEKLRITSAGKVGIGTNNPIGNLQINNDSEPALYLYNGGTRKMGLQAQDSFGSILYSYDSEPLIFSVASGTSFSEKLRIDSSGHFGFNVGTGNGYTAQFNDTAGSCTLQLTNATIGSGSGDGSRITQSTSGILYIENQESSSTVFSTAGTERLSITSVGRVLIGPGPIATPKCGNAGLDVGNNDYSIVMGGSDGNGARANTANKDGRLCGPHYTNAEEPVGMLRCTSGSSNNEVHMGGGSSLVNAATELYFYTAANTTTTGGTARLSISATGLSAFASGSSQRTATFTGNGIEINHASGSNVFIGTNDGTDGKIGTINDQNFSLFTDNDLALGATLTTAGNFSLPDGNFIVASGHGIDFGARTPDGTSVSNELLDDYEEGTWTATIENYTSSVTSSITNTTGYYTKVGNVVTCSWYSNVISLSGSQSGAAQIGGLPFVSINSSEGYQVANFAHNNSFAHTITNGYTVPNQSRIVAVQNNSTQTSTWNTGGGNRYLMMQITYLTNT